jgi:hypothetical protein
MNEKRNDRQQDKTGRDGGMQRDPQPGRDREQQDRSRTGQVGGGEAQEDKERQGQRGQQGQQKGGIGQPKPGREMDEDVE